MVHTIYYCLFQESGSSVSELTELLDDCFGSSVSRNGYGKLKTNTKAIHFEARNVKFQQNIIKATQDLLLILNIEISLKCR